MKEKISPKNNIEYILQKWLDQPYADLFRIALRKGIYDKMFAAVAYATVGGVSIIENIFREEFGTKNWDSMSKQWLVGIDWCRSDPRALSQLEAFNRSQVKIPNGEKNISRLGCLPDKIFHPKLYILQGKDLSAIICGSGNLSRSGLTKGCECGNVLLIKSSQNPQLIKLLSWFYAEWEKANPYSKLKDVYIARCKQSLKNKDKFVPTEDDLTPEQFKKRVQKKPLSELQIRQLQTFDNFWIQAGALGGNLGPDKPGNQLDMTRYTRVFFGYPALDVKRNKIIGHVTLIWDGQDYFERTLKFGNNEMDKLNVPPSGDHGPLFYKNKTLLFTRNVDGSFLFTVVKNADCAKWRRLSKQLNAHYTMQPRGREWGLF